MKSFDFQAMTYNGEAYCLSCLPAEAKQDGDTVYPIFAREQWGHYPVCVKCGEVHDYVTLTIGGLREAVRTLAAVALRAADTGDYEHLVEIEKAMRECLS